MVKVKKTRCSEAVVYQLRRYLEAVANNSGWTRYLPVRSLLVSPVLEAKTLIETDEQISFCRLSYQQLRQEENDQQKSKLR